MTAYTTATAVALGSFDGVHAGHISVLASALSKRESGLVPVCLVFDEHPAVMLGGDVRLITAYDLRDELIGSMGLEIETLSFAEVSGMSGREFFEEVILEKLNADCVCCGENYHFGKGGKCGVDELRALCDEYSVELCVSNSVVSDNLPVSSTRIRSAIENGDVSLAHRLLTRPFMYRYEVVRGDARGRTMGFPTINQNFPKNSVVPASGVYASFVELDDGSYPAVTNIGVRPTFGPSSLRSETHIIGYSGDLYGQNVTVSLLDYIRDEKKFDSLQDLIDHMNKDKTLSTEINKKYCTRK